MAEIRDFDTGPDGEAVRQVTIGDGALTARILTWGARLQDLRLAGTPWPLTLGSPTLAGYLGPMASFGAVVGPVANRIGGAEAVVAGRRCWFPANEGGRTTLHGGPRGTHARNWTVAEAAADRVTLTLDLPDRLDGFPGNRRLAAAYHVEAPSTLWLTLSSDTDRDTLINLAPHPYWNLDGTPDIAGHRLTINADHMTPTDDALIPTGAVAAVAGTRFDFRAGQSLAQACDLDLNLCLSEQARGLTRAAVLEGSKGVCLTLSTTEPGLQVHDAPAMGTAPWIGLTGQPYGPRGGIALEPQLWPDACHHATFPSILLAAGQARRQVTRMTFMRTR